MKFSLRTTITLPILGAAALLTFLSAWSLLDSLHHQLRSSIENTLRIEWARVAPEFASIREESKRARSLLGGGITVQVADSERVPEPSEFLNSDRVGLVIVTAAEVPPADGGSKWSVTIPSEKYALIYREARVRVILWSGLAMAVAAGISLWLTSEIKRRLTPLSVKASFLARKDNNAAGTPGPNDPILLLGERLDVAGLNLNRFESQLRRLQVVRSQFLANVSHEIRTPIFALRGYLESLLDGGLDDPNVRVGFVSKAYGQAQRLDALLRDLVDIARIESGEMKMSFRYFDLSELASEVIDEQRSSAEKRGQQLDLDLPTGRISAIGDKDRLRQVLTNLIDNAIKYSGNGSTISVRAVAGERVARVDVEDTGVGIPKEHLPRIFERFYRVDEDRSRELGGTGLGLAIVKHIIEAHGSSISVISELAKGTLFSFELKRES